MGGSAVRATPVGLVVVAVVGLLMVARGAVATWCIARSGASAAALQSSLDYACGGGIADCLPIQASGLCYLPNTLPAHASYAFNSYYQRSGAAAGACDFAGTATVTITDPSYGSCTYPSSSSTAGGSTTSPPNTNTPPMLGTPMIGTPTAPGLGGTGGSVGGLTPGLGPPLPNIDTSGASAASSLLPLLLSAFFYTLRLLL